MASRAMWARPVKRWFGGAGGGVDGQVVKSFPGRRGKDYDRYAPPTKPMISKRPVFGAPDMSECSMSYVERTNLSVRTCLRRLVRRGTGHSNTVRHHAVMVAIFVAWFNWCRVHESLRVTPAMQAGLADHVWSVEELIAAEPSEPPEPRRLAPRAEKKKQPSRVTSTGVRLRAVDGGKAPKPVRQKAQVDLWEILKRMKEKEEGPPPDAPEKVELDRSHSLSCCQKVESDRLARHATSRVGKPIY